MVVVDGKTSENYAGLTKSMTITPENQTKTALNDALMDKYTKITAKNDVKSAIRKIVINHLTIGIS